MDTGKLPPDILTRLLSRPDIFSVNTDSRLRNIQAVCLVLTITPSK